jgi:hypothetical protein
MTQLLTRLDQAIDKALMTAPQAHFSSISETTSWLGSFSGSQKMSSTHLRNLFSNAEIVATPATVPIGDPSLSIPDAIASVQAHGQGRPWLCSPQWQHQCRLPRR